MTAPRAREQADPPSPPSPPDRRPPRRGGGSSPSTSAASAAGGLRGLLRSARRAGLAAAGLAGLVLGSLALAPPAQAQSTTEILSATLTVGAGSVGSLGYSVTYGSLSKRNFTYADTEYRIVSVLYNPTHSNPRLQLQTLPTLPVAGAQDSLTLVLGGTNYAFADADREGIVWYWDNEPSWSNGDSVSLSITEVDRPELDSSGVGFDGNQIFLIFDKNLGSPSPGKSAFSITADESPISIGNITRGDAGLLNLLSLSPVIGNGQTVKLEYTDPTTGNDSNAIQDADGVDAASFTTTITNGSTVTLAALSEAEVLASGQIIALTFSRDLDFSGTFTATIRDAFSVTVDGTANAVTGFSGSGDTATLTMADTIEGGQTVVVGYDRSDAGSEALGTSSTKLVADFTTGANSVPAVTNNSMLTRARLASATVNATGTDLTLTFDKDLNTVSTGIVSQFTITVDGIEKRIIGSQGFSSADDNFKLLFRSSNPIYKDEAVVVTYEKPAGSDGLTDEEDDLPVASFTTGEFGVPAVTNNSGVYAPPTLSSAEVQARGDEIYLGFSEGLDVPATVAQALKDAFTVTVDGVEREFDDLEFFGLGDSFVKLTFTTAPIQEGTAVVVSYDASAAGTSALEGGNSNKVADFTTGAGGVVAVTNNSTVSSDATLSGLTVSINNAASVALVAVALSPAFDSAIEAYSVSVAANRSVVSFMPTPSQTDATVAYFDADDMALADAGTTTSDLNAGHQVNTAVGENVIKVKVTAPDKTTEKTYTVTVTRELPTLFNATVQANGTSVLLQFQSSFPSGTGSLPAAAVAAFTVTADGVEREITGIVREITEAILNVTLSTAIYEDQAVVVSYDSAAAGADAIEDTDGNAFQSFTSGEDGVPAAVNNSTQTFPTPSTPTNFTATEGDKRVILAWDPPAATDPITRHEFRYKTTGDYLDDWTQIPDSGPGGANEAGYTVTGLTNGTAYTFQLRAANRQNQGTAAESTAVTPADTTPPTLSSAEVGVDVGTTIELTFSEDLHQVPLIVPTAIVSAFTVKVGGVERQISNMVANVPSRLAATLSSAIYSGQTVVVSYDKSVAGSDAIADAADNEVASFTTGEDGVPAVVNNSNVMAPVSTPTPASFAAAPGNARVVLSWDPPAADSGVTRHEYRFKEEGTGSYPPDWTAIPDSGVDEANQAEFTVTADLTNETAYTFQLRAVNADGASTAAEAGPVTPTPGICDRTPQVRDEILNALSGVDDCTAVTVADLATVTDLYINNRQNVTALQSGDFAGLSAVEEIQLRRNALTGLPSDLFSGLSALRVLTLADNALSSLPPGVFSGLSALEDLGLSGNAGLGPHLTGSAFSALGGLRLINLNGIGLDTVPAGLFSGLSELTDISLDGNGIEALPASLFSGLARLEVLSLGANGLGTLPDGVFSGLSALTDIVLTGNRLTELSAGVFSGLTKLKTIRLASNSLRTLPDGVFAGLTDLELLLLADNSGLLPVTVTLETVAGGQVRAKVLAGAPSDLTLRVSVENGVLARGAEALQVATGLVAGAPVQVIRTEDSGEVTVDLVTPLPSPTPGHSGYVFVRAASGLPAEVADALEREPGEEGEFRLAPETVAGYDDPANDRYGEKAGRVEVYHAGAWGTVCSDGIRHSTFNTFDHDANGDVILDADGNPQQFDKVNEAAALICQAMDYDDGEYAWGFGQSGVDNPPSGQGMTTYYPVGSSYPPGGPQPIWLDELRCVAGETALETDPLRKAMSHCSYAGWGLHNCTHEQDAGVRCWNDEPGGPGLKSLKGRFVSPPERHDGTNRVKVRVAFSEPVEESPENVGAHGVEVEGGEVTSVSPVGVEAPDGAGTRSAGGRNAGGEDREVVWEFEIEPDSDGDLTVTLEAGRPCGEPGAICTADGRALSEGISTTVEGPEAPPPLTASFEDMPEAHDGAGAFRFRVAFSEPIAISYRSLREEAFAVTGGRVTRGKRVDDRRDLFEMTVEPDGDGEVTVTLPAGRECSVSGAICTWGPPRKQLTNTPTATVAGPAVETGPASLTARFVDMPSEHDGETAFKFRIAFSEEIRMSGRRLRSDVVAVSGGRATKAGRVNRRKDLWKLKVRPDSLADVTVTLSSGAACDTPGAVCTADGRALSNTISATVRGPVTVSVADARAREGEDETIDFAVSLSRAASGRVSVSYATADGTATAGSDYTRASGKLRFAPGETEKTISVPVLDDAHDEGEETMTLRLSAASGAAIADGVATGTIENTDHMPAAWLARFGRTVTDQVLDAVGERLAAPRAAGAQATLAGQALPSWDGSGKAAADPGTGSGAGGDATAANDNPGSGSGAGDNAASERALAARDRDAMTAIRDWMARSGADRPGAGASDPWGEGPEDRERSRALTGRDFLTGTSFALTGGSAEAGGYAALWGRGAISRFDGREGDLTLDGEVTTGLIGADWASAPGSRRWTAGLAVGHARGTGSYREGGGCNPNDVGTGADGDPGDSGCSGEIEATLTGLWPYGGLQLTDRLSAWGALGYGAGEMKLMPGGDTSPFTADLTMAMGAAGLRGEVLTPPPEGGLALAVKGDMRFTRTASEATKDAANKGRLEAAEADVWLVRTGIEGSRRFVLGGDTEGMVIEPSFELGARLDGGDAETGLGVDLGGGLAFAAPRQDVALDLKGRGLIAHEASGFREWGASAALTWDPRPETDRGLALRLRQSWGGSPTGGMDALLGRETLAGLAANDDGGTASAGRLEAELGYGIALFDGGFTGTPNLGVGFSETGRDYRVGWRLTSARRGDPGFTIDLDATRREAADADAEHGLMLRCTIRW